MSIVRSLNATALHARTADLCTTNRWVEDSGFTVPAAYSSPSEEQWSLSERVALSDLSARQTWSFRGVDAASFLSFATLNDVTALAPSRVIETYWCDDTGFVRGKGTVIRRDANLFEMTTSVRDFAWMLDGAEGFDVELRDVTAERAVIGVSGPLAAALLADAAILSKEMHAGDLADAQYRGSRFSILRRGESQRFELLLPAEDAILAWDRLWRAGRSIGLGVAGADALESARIEAGQLKPIVDWLPAQAALSDEDLRIPLDFGVEPELTRCFNGVDALRRASANGRQVPIQLLASEAMVVGAITAKGATIGHVTSSAWSEPRNENVALAWVDPSVATIGGTLKVCGSSGPVEARVSALLNDHNS